MHLYTHVLTRHLYINPHKYTQQSSLIAQAGETFTHSTTQTSHQDFTTPHYVEQHKDIPHFTQSHTYTTLYYNRVHIYIM